MRKETKIYRDFLNKNLKKVGTGWYQYRDYDIDVSKIDGKWFATLLVPYTQYDASLTKSSALYYACKEIDQLLINIL